MLRSQDQPRQWAPIADTSEKTHESLGQAQSTGHAPAAESKSRLTHCSRPVLPNPVSPQKPKVVSLGAMRATTINNDAGGKTPHSELPDSSNNEDGPFTRGADRATNYDDMPPLYSDDDDDAGPPTRGAIRGAIRGVATMILSPNDEKA